MLRDRRLYFRTVWLVQFGGWLLRCTAFWFLLEAFGVGGSVRNVLLVLGVNAVAAVVPFTPGGAGVQQALLVTVFAGNAAAATVAAYSVGQQIAIATVSLAVGFAALFFVFGFRSFRDVRNAGREHRDAEKAAGKHVGPRRSAQALARLAHERDGLGEDGRHDRAYLLGLLGRRPLHVDAVDRRDGHVDRELDRVVRPGERLLALKLLGELRHALLQLVRVTEQISETAHAFHA